MKYTTKEIVKTIARIAEIGSEGHSLEREELTEIIDEQRQELANCTYKDYNIQAFNELIKTIEHNGLTNFNMNTFFSLINHEDYTKDFSYVHEISRSQMARYIPEDVKLFDNRTNKFNCNTIGCIAGFATAVAMEWQNPSWLTGDSRDYNSHFETIACTYLNIPIWVGKKIFYGDDASVWAFGKLYSHKLGHAYDHLKLTEDYEHLDEYNFEEYWNSVDIDLNSISYKDAVNMLSDIAEGKIIFGENIPNGIMLNPNLARADKRYGTASGEVA